MKITPANKNLDIIKLQEEFEKLPQVECEITHRFSDGLYTRERFAKADTMIIGKRHRHETTSMLMQGILSVYLDGGEVIHHEAPDIWKTPPGAKRMTYSQTDTILVTVHPTNETDLDKIESEVIISEEEFLQIEGGL